MLLAIKNVTIDPNLPERVLVQFPNGRQEHLDLGNNVKNPRILFVDKYGFAVGYENADGQSIYTTIVYDARSGFDSDLGQYKGDDPMMNDIVRYCREYIGKYQTEEDDAKELQEIQKKEESFNKNTLQQKATWAETNELKNARNSAIILALAECAAAYYFFTNGYPVLSIVIGLVALVLTIVFRKIVFRSLRVLVVGGIPATILVIGGGAIKDGEGSDYLIHGIILAVLWFAFAIYLEVKGKLRRKKPSSFNIGAVFKLMDSISHASGGRAHDYKDLE